jgi:copper transport protein
MGTIAIAVIVSMVFLSGRALAHTDFDYSDPADGDEVAASLDEIVVAFTEPVTVVGNGFEVLDPAGSIVEPEVETSDDVVFHLLLDVPLVGGDAGVRYEVASEDGHVVSGGFSFTVADAITTTTMGETTTTRSAATSNRPPDTTVQVPATTVPAAAVAVGDDDGASRSVIPLVVGALALVAVGIYLARRSRAPSGK